jgi:UDP-N-acetylmuramate dehydrogenase
MNAGCYGSETVKVVLSRPTVMTARPSARAVTCRTPTSHFTYRTAALRTAGRPWCSPTPLFEGTADDPAAIKARMDEITARRETTQPIREKTGGSTFKNPPGHSPGSWSTRPAGAARRSPPRWRRRAAAMFSPLHANFLINQGEATAADLEGLGEAVRADVAAQDRRHLEWEIKRIGRPALESTVTVQRSC